MNNNKHYLRSTSWLGFAIATILTSTSVIAADEGWYAGASVGQTDADLRFNQFNLAALPAGASLVGLGYDDTDVGFKLFGGYQFSGFFAVESGYFDLGEYSFNGTTSPAGTTAGSFEVDGLFIDMVGTIPLTAKLDFLARAGFNYADTTSKITGTGVVASNISPFSNRYYNPKLGVGLQYELASNMDLRFEAERYHVDEPVKHKGNIDLFSVGIVYRFGQKPEVRQPATVAQAAPVARVEPTPTPAPTPPPPTPAPVRVEFSADSLFDFDQSVIKSTGTAELDRFIANLNSVTFDVIQVTGHTDRIGNRDYNLALSQRRADAVKTYLVQTGRLPASKITAIGVNGADSLIGANECTGTATKAAQILCLQPDRRVVVEVTATR